jgi:hypothetical protein
MEIVSRSDVPLCDHEVLEWLTTHDFLRNLPTWKAVQECLSALALDAKTSEEAYSQERIQGIVDEKVPGYKGYNEDDLDDLRGVAWVRDCVLLYINDHVHLVPDKEALAGMVAAFKEFSAEMAEAFPDNENKQLVAVDIVNLINYRPETHEALMYALCADTRKSEHGGLERFDPSESQRLFAIVEEFLPYPDTKGKSYSANVLPDENSLDRSITAHTSH